MGNLPIRITKKVVQELTSAFDSIRLLYPKKVSCNVCGWEGRHFLSDSWHRHINCPRCHSGIRHRLFMAAIQHVEKFSFENIIQNKRILHFAPESVISRILRDRSVDYATADLIREDCDFRLNMQDMPSVKDGSFDVVIAFDVLEHIPDYRKALREVRRILSLKGFGIFTIPQKDDLRATYENPLIVTPKDRTKHFGQRDHLRIFGSDFSETVEKEGFSVIAVNESMFSEAIKRKNVLFPPVLSRHPLATNHRKVFFCQKIS